MFWYILNHNIVNNKCSEFSVTDVIEISLYRKYNCDEIKMSHLGYFHPLLVFSTKSLPTGFPVAARVTFWMKPVVCTI